MNTGAQRPSNVLTQGEIAFLSRALAEWGGPAHANDALARAMGFVDAASMRPRQRELDRALLADSPLVSADWARILVSSEVVFVSDLYGSGTEWRTTTGWDDKDTIQLLRGIQRKLGPVLRGQYGGIALES